MNSPTTTPRPQQDELVYLGRQAIFDRRREVCAYELLYRTGARNAATVEDGDQATARVIANTFMEMGLESVTGSRPAFVNMTREFLMSDFATIFPADRVALEILEDVAVDDALVARVKELKELGYRIVLDDFVFSPELRPLAEIADVIKLDLMAMDEPELDRHVRLLKDFNADLLAEKIESEEVFRACLDRGFKYFQGYVLCRPQVLEGRRTPENRMGLMRLLAKVNEPNVELEELDELISRDVSLSYRLLKYINSALLALKTPVDSIHHAIMLLGKPAIRTWVNVLTLAGFLGRPHEVITTAMVRAKMCETLALERGHEHTGPFFTVGLFSTLDVLMDRDLSEVIDELNLSDSLRGALLGHVGPEGEVLAKILEYERAAWDQSALANMRDTIVRDSYVDALKWALQVEHHMSSDSKT